MKTQVWTDNDFDDMSWHDNHVHAFRIVEGEYGAGELVFDIDYLAVWRKCGSGSGCEFEIVPSLLTFRDVTHLRISLDYATPMAALGPFSISEIERVFESRERYTAQIWKIALNWPNGEIVFEASGYIQKGYGDSIICKEQALSPEQRNGCV